MKKSLSRKVVLILLLVCMAVTSVVPCKAASANTRKNLSNINLCISNPDAKTKNELLYGGDTAEYALGVAAHFSLFGSEVGIYPAADCLGRVAADEFYVDALPYYGGENREFGFSGNLTSGKDAGGAATIICNNAISKSFGMRVAPEHNGKTHKFVVSKEVTRFESAPSVPHNAAKIEKNSYAVEKNSLINFDKEVNELVNLSNLFAAQTSGKVTIDGGKITLTGASSTVNYFTIDSSVFKNVYEFRINVPQNAFAIINVSGDDIVFTENLSWSFRYGTSNVQVSDMDTVNRYFLFNFYEASKVTLAGPSRGNILAPKAFVTDKDAGYHNAGQIIAKKVYLKHEIGDFGFIMPKTYLPAEAYTVHYMYYDVNGDLKEIPSDLYRVFINATAAPDASKNSVKDAYQKGDSVQAVSDKDVNSALASFKAKEDMKLFLQQYSKDCDIRFAVYEDGKTWNNAVTGNALTNPSTYASMNKKADIAWDETYKFGNSNVYFIMYPTAKVKVDVSFDDKQNKSGKRPTDFDVALVEKVGSSATKSATGNKIEKDVQDLLDNKSNTVTLFDEELKKDIAYDVFKDGYEFSVPLFGMQADANGQYTGRNYGVSLDKFGENGLFDISYTVPDDYYDVTLTRVDKPTNGALVDENGYAAEFHIVLRGEYKARFFIVDENGKRTEVFKENFYDVDYEKFRGFSSTEPLPELSNSELKSVFGYGTGNDKYVVDWVDTKTGICYMANGDEDSIYNFDYEDVVFETTIRMNELEGETPWLFTHIISYNGSHYIPGNMIWKRMDMDGTTDPTTGGFQFIQKKNISTNYSYGTVKAGNYDKDYFFMLSFAFGVDVDRAAATRVTVSTEGFGAKSKVFYEAQTMETKLGTLGFSKTFFSMKGTPVKTIEEILPRDYFLKDYDGLRYFRLALPTDDFEDAKLYFTVYYIDEEGTESVWFRYVLDMQNNNMWTIKKLCDIVEENKVVVVR